MSRHPRITPRTGDTPLEAALRLRLKQLREERGWSVRELARTAGVGSSGVQGIEQGTRSASLATVQALADALLVDPLDLLTPPPG